MIVYLYRRMTRSLEHNEAPPTRRFVWEQYTSLHEQYNLKDTMAEIAALNDEFRRRRTQNVARVALQTLRVYQVRAPRSS